MARAAIISDIHANLEALEAVLADIDRQGIEEILCLGDIVGYGPDPAPCVDLVRERCRIVICGNHDEALFKGAWGFHQVARDAIDWTRKVLVPRFYRPGSKGRWDYLAGLPPVGRWEGYLLVHGSPRSPTEEYVMPVYAKWPPQAGMFEEIFAAFETVCFVGHTHLPGVFVERPKLQFTPQSEIVSTFRHQGPKMLVNVGSVGQPRDHNPRACYLTVEGEEFRFHRVEYPVHVTQEKIRSNSALDDRLAVRLGEGE
jgi:predicted phosphodiesterase